MWKHIYIRNIFEQLKIQSDYSNHLIKLESFSNGINTTNEAELNAVMRGVCSKGNGRFTVEFLWHTTAPSVSCSRVECYAPLTFTRLRACVVPCGCGL